MKRMTQSIGGMKLGMLALAAALFFSLNTTGKVYGEELEMQSVTTSVVETTTLPAVTETESTTVTPTTVQRTIQTIKLNKKKLRLRKGKKKTLKASIRYITSEGVKEKYTWKSSNKKIATVSAKGTVKAKKSGKVWIACKSTSGNVVAKCRVTVFAPYNKVASLALNQKQIRLNKGNHRYLKAVVKYQSKKYAKNEGIVWKSKNKKIATVSKSGVVKGKKNGTTYIVAKSRYTGKSVKCKVTVGYTKYIAITFDDGPGPYTNRLLDALNKYDSKATFFLVGQRVNTYAAILRRESALGMQIGNHTWSHAKLSALTAAGIKSQINGADSAIRNVLGKGTTIFRPPYGSYNATVAASVNVPMLYWSVDTLDWKYRNTAYVKNTILSRAYDGAVVLLHDIHATSVEGFIQAQPTLVQRHYELVTAEELFKIKSRTMQKGKMYYAAK